MMMMSASLSNVDFSSTVIPGVHQQVWIVCSGHSRSGVIVLTGSQRDLTVERV